MVKMDIQYQGHKHCKLTHESSGSIIETDAPKDNQGKGEKFSPTDLIGASLGSCILTTMAIVAERDGIAFETARAEVTKEMTSQPRRIGALKLNIHLPSSLNPEQRKKMEETAHHCPVHRSIHPDVQISLNFSYA